MNEIEMVEQQINATPATGGNLASRIFDLESRRVAVERQAVDFAKLISTGNFPLLPQSVSKFSLIPGATAALERIDTMWREATKNA